MAGADATCQATVPDASHPLYAAIGAFLAANGLSPDPAHFAFAYRILTEPAGLLAQSVRLLTEGGVRLSSRDIMTLGGEIGALAVPAPATTPSVTAEAEGLVAQTQMQVEGFSDMVAAMRAEARGFGRDLAASADAMRSADPAPDATEIVRITASMLERVRETEAKLDAATHEAGELRLKLEEARGDARRDPLTNLANRRAFEEAYDSQAVPDETRCLAVCDIDHFKAINDRFGHSVGDRVLKVIAEALAQACGEHLVARYGGEEFAILFRGVDIDDARATLESARRAVAARRYRLRESDEPIGSVTFSAGLTAVAEGETLGTSFGRADTLLYAAKNGGRNLLRAA